MFEADQNQVVDIPLDLIEVDDAWNARSGKWFLDDGNEEGNQFSDFRKSLREGQKTPILVTRRKDTRKPYRLVAGYRRCRGVAENAAEDGTMPVMRCIVVDLDEVAARTENLCENVNRSDLTAADTAWGIAELRKASVASGNELSANQIGQRIGKSQPYVHRLLQIMEKCLPNITKRWRESPKALSVYAMYQISQLPKDQQEKAFADLMGCIERRKEPTTESRARSSWVDTARKKAFDIGTLLGRLEAEGLIDTSGLDWDTHLDLLIKVKESATKSTRAAIASQFNRGYKTAKEGKEQPDLIVGDEEE
jgi:ParB/RepB/Spo0J family partition protein